MRRSVVLIAVILSVTCSAKARVRHHGRRPSSPAVLQPFLLARSIVHAAANPMVFGARPGAVAPIRLAYYASPIRRARPPRRSIQDEEVREMPSIESGNPAVLRNGIARPPPDAPAKVKNAIEAANSLRGKPYIWGGGHGSFHDRGYDCSGSVSFALHQAGLLSAPLPSSELMRFGEGGRGRWITIYARPGHTFATIAGLRFDTTDFASGGNIGPRWHIDGRDTFGYVARHPAGL